MKGFFDKYGVVKVDNTTTDNEPYKKNKTSQDEIEICLNCTKKNCTGYCVKIEKYRRKRNETEN